LEGLWFILALLLAIWFARSAYKGYTEHVRRKSWEAKVNEVRELVRPVVEDSYAKLVEEIRHKWPFVPFDFPDLDALLANIGGCLGYGIRYQQSIEALAKRVLYPVVSTSVKNFINYNPDFIGSGQVVNSLSFVQPSTYGIYFRTANSRNPPDWAERRRAVYDRDGGRCRRCGITVPLERSHIHHLVRRSEGGSHSLDNLVTLCRDCHSLMPEHQRVDGGPFYTSNSGYTLHIQECFHATRQISGSLPSLLATGYRPCMKCLPNLEMRKLWIERFARARLSAIVKSMASRSERKLSPVSS